MWEQLLNEIVLIFIINIKHNLLVFLSSTDFKYLIKWLEITINEGPLWQAYSHHYCIWKATLVQKRPIILLLFIDMT